jgi:hypothetical protein
MGFVFMHLGRVFFLKDTIRDKLHNESKTSAEMPWYDSGFVLVVEIYHSGIAGA